MRTSSELPLAGLKVIAIEQAVAAPLASARLADAGAEVIKIERPEGDFARGYDQAAKGQSSYFVWLNRGKKSLALDLTTSAGKAALRAQIRDADVVVQNLKSGALERLGFAPGQLRKEFPALITCSITGYGDQGPLAHRKAYDLLVQAEAGLCSVTGTADAPARVGTSVVDIATGATAYASILEALIRRGRTGQGAEISLSLFDVIAEWMTVPLLNHENGDSPTRIGLGHPSIAPYGAFPTADGQVLLIAIQSDREWQSLCRGFLENEDLCQHPDFATNVARVANRAATDQHVARAFAKRTTADAIEALEKAKVAFASVNDMEGLSHHPHLRRIQVQTPNGAVSYPAPAPIFVGESRKYGPVPALTHVKQERQHDD